MFKGIKVLVCIGSGGVGKTSVAAALGMLAADRGLKVLVLTIDPSRRLATTLGIQGELGVVKVPNQQFKGELYASVIDHQKTFDDFLMKAAHKKIDIERILKNPLYQKLSTTLSGSQEFTAMEKLLEMVESEKFDLVILDTPPAQHAKDFLEAPRKISLLFNDKIAKWFRGPDSETTGFFRKMMNQGTVQIFKILEMVTGASFLGQLKDFFGSIYSWQDQLKERTERVHDLLLSEKTHFCLVTSFDEAKIKEAQDLEHEISQGGYHLKTIVINRYFPDWLKAQKTFRSVEVQKAHEKFLRYYQKREVMFNNFQKTNAQGKVIIKLPEYFEQVQDLKSLEKVALQMSEQVKD